MLDHTGPLNTCIDCNIRYALTNHSAVLGLADLSFDLSVWDVFGVLGTGAKLVLPQPHVITDPPALARHVAVNRITHWSVFVGLSSLHIDC